MYPTTSSGTELDQYGELVPVLTNSTQQYTVHKCTTDRLQYPKHDPHYSQTDSGSIYPDTLRGEERNSRRERRMYASRGSAVYPDASATAASGGSANVNNKRQLGMDAGDEWGCEGQII